MFEPQQATKNQFNIRIELVPLITLCFLTASITSVFTITTIYTANAPVQTEACAKKVHLITLFVLLLNLCVFLSWDSFIYLYTISFHLVLCICCLIIQWVLGLLTGLLTGLASVQTIFYCKCCCNITTLVGIFLNECFSRMCIIFLNNTEQERALNHSNLPQTLENERAYWSDNVTSSK